MNGLELYDKVRVVPPEAQKTITGGRLNGKTDINPMWRIKALTEHFGPCGLGWYYNTTDNWLEQSGNEVAAFVKIELFVKYGDEWSKPISGTGGSMFVSKEKNGTYVSDECYKMATTDAISVACKQLGIGADVYWQADKTKYDKPEPQDKPVNPGINKKQINELLSECDRIGKSEKAICTLYKVKKFSDMQQWQYESAMKNFRVTPDKPVVPADPATIPPENADEGLPWKSQKG